MKLCVKTSFRRCKRPGSLCQGIPKSTMKLHNDVLEDLNFFIPVHQRTEMITKNVYTFNERLVGWWYMGDLLVYFAFFFQKSKNESTTNQPSSGELNNSKCLIYCLLDIDLCVICIACASKHRKRTASTFAHSLATDTTIWKYIFNQMIHMVKHKLNV